MKPSGSHELAILEEHASDVPVFMEFNPRPSLGSMEKPLPSLAGGDLLWRENAADRVPGVLGVRVARTCELMAFSEMDLGDGTLRASQGQESLTTATAGSGFSRPAGLERFPQLPGVGDSEGRLRERRS